MKIDFETRLCALLSGYLRDVSDRLSIDGAHEYVTMEFAKRLTKSVSKMRLKSFIFGISIGICLGCGIILIILLK